MEQIPDIWFLLQVGSTIKDSIDSSETTIPVIQTRDSSNNPLFEAGDIVACGFESMNIISVDDNAKTITVNRGFYRKASSHNAGETVNSITIQPKDGRILLK